MHGFPKDFKPNSIAKGKINQQKIYHAEPWVILGKLMLWRFSRKFQSLTKIYVSPTHHKNVTSCWERKLNEIWTFFPLDKLRKIFLCASDSWGLKWFEIKVCGSLIDSFERSKKTLSSPCFLIHPFNGTSKISRCFQSNFSL